VRCACVWANHWAHRLHDRQPLQPAEHPDGSSDAQCAIRCGAFADCPSSYILRVHPAATNSTQRVGKLAST